MPQPSQVFPCVVPESYISAVGPTSCVHRPFGNGLVLTLAVDMGESVRNLQPQEMTELVESLDDAWQLAIYNLDQEFQNQRLVVQVVDYPSGGQAAMIGPHWLASALLAHPGITPWLQSILGSQQLIAVVPERDSSFVISATAPQDVVQGAKRFAVEAHANARKPYTPAWFSLSEQGPDPIAPP